MAASGNDRILDDEGMTREFAVAAPTDRDNGVDDS
jgi:hypothetical protein